MMIQLIVNRICSNVYTSYAMACIMDLHHGFSMCGLDNMRLIDPVELSDERLMWSYRSVKRVFMKIEKEMREEITFKKISEMHMGNRVDGVSFDPEELFSYIINHIGIGEVANKRSIEVWLNVYGDPI
jgi:hypothetical protein